MNNKIKNRLKLISPAFLLLFLSSCKRVVDNNGKVMEEFIIKLTDSWNLNQGLFDALIVWPLSQLINFFSQYVGPVGAIIVITVAVKLATLPYTIKSQIMSQKMQELNPKIQAIQAKYRDRKDQQAQMQQAQEMQNLYRKYDIKLSAMFVPMLLQLPILIALFQAVQRSYSVINGSFLGHSLLITPLHGMQTGSIVHYVIFISLTILQGISMLLPSWLAKQKAKKYPGTKAPQKNTMMYVMVVMFAYFGLVWSTGMAIYFIVSATIQIGQTFYSHKIINKN